MNLTPTCRQAVLSWTAGFAAAAVVQGRFPRRFAQGTAWGGNEGWQREIAIWNVGLVTIVLGVRRPGADVDRALITGFSVLSTLFAANHLAAAVRSPRSHANWIGAAGNIGGLAIGALAFAAS